MDIKSKFDTNNEYKTEKQWKKQNRIVNQGEVGRKMWCNGYCHQIAEYFSIEQTHPATTEELKLLKNNRRLIQKRYLDNAKVRREETIREQVSREWDDYYQEYKFKSLEVCANYFDYKFNAHNALDDVKATLYCYKQMRLLNIEVEMNEYLGEKHDGMAHLYLSGQKNLAVSDDALILDPQGEL